MHKIKQKKNTCTYQLASSKCAHMCGYIGCRYIICTCSFMHTHTCTYTWKLQNHQVKSMVCFQVTGGWKLQQCQAVPSRTPSTEPCPVWSSRASPASRNCPNCSYHSSVPQGMDEKSSSLHVGQGLSAQCGTCMAIP